MFEDSADFSGIFKSNKPLKVTSISHKAFININEYGCEAAASTRKENDSTVRFIIYYCLLNNPYVFILVLFQSVDLNSIH